MLRAMPAPQPDPSRAWFLDWLRIAALLWLVVYHVMAYYARWPWHVNSPLAALSGPWVEPLMRLSSPWRMSLLFVVSGAATATLLARDGATGAALRQRSRRLLLPLLLGVALVVAPQSWLEVRDRFGYRGGLIDFLPLYWGFDSGFADARGRLLLPTWNHLWFLPYLFVYTLALWALLRWRPAWLDRAAAHAPQALRGWRLAVLPLAAPAAARLLVSQGWPHTHALLDDPASHVLYAPAFAWGVLLARAPSLWLRLQAWRHVALWVALGGWALWMVGGRSLPGQAGAVLLAWAALVALLGLAQRHGNHDHRWRATLSEAVFPVYLVHQTVTVVLAVALRPLALPWPAEALLLVLATLLAGAGFYRAVRPWPRLRPWVGLAPGDRLRPGPAKAPAGCENAPLSRSAPPPCSP